MQSLSVVIITFNEERNIRRCIESALQVSDDVVIWDSFSTDQTPSICEQFPVRFFQAKWEGYSISKNKANAQARHDWILSLDADEALSNELLHSIQQMKCDGWRPASFARLTNYCGSWIHHCGWYPDVKWRLFNRQQVAWEGVIHESLQWKCNSEAQPICLLQGDCLHYSYYTKEDHYRQAEKFVTIMAKEKVQSGGRTFWWMRFLSPISKFIQMYFFKWGMLDGVAGWKVCLRSAWASYKKYQLWYQFQNQNNS